MKQKPFFQMTIVENKRGYPALIFSSELKNDYSQNIVYCIPIYYTLNKTELLINHLSESILIMPFSFENEVVNIKASIDFPFIYFDLTQFGIKERIQFRLNFFSRDKDDFFELANKKKKSNPYYKILRMLRGYNSIYKDTEFVTLNYIGNWGDIQKGNNKFLIVTPTNINLLDTLYREFKLVPVGFTPNFGNYKSGDFNSAQQ